MMSWGPNTKSAALLILLKLSPAGFFHWWPMVPIFPLTPNDRAALGWLWFAVRNDFKKECKEKNLAIKKNHTGIWGSDYLALRLFWRCGFHLLLVFLRGKLGKSHLGSFSFLSRCSLRLCVSPITCKDLSVVTTTYARLADGCVCLFLLVYDSAEKTSECPQGWRRHDPWWKLLAIKFGNWSWRMTGHNGE